MMRRARIIGLAALLTGCATQYKPDGFTGGFSERQMAADTYIVTFNGNGYTDNQRARDFLLLRCADLAIAHDAKFFRLVGSEKDSRDGAAVLMNGNMAFAAPIHFPSETATIQLRQDHEGPQDFDAAIVSASMRKAYNLK